MYTSNIKNKQIRPNKSKLLEHVDDTQNNSTEISLKNIKLIIDDFN